MAVICFAMFMGAFVAGLSCYKFNRRQLAWVNCFAAGLLLGTALGVIIPEGVRALYEESVSSLHTTHHHFDHESGGHDIHPESLVGECCCDVAQVASTDTSAFQVGPSFWDSSS